MQFTAFPHQWWNLVGFVNRIQEMEKKWGFFLGGGGACNSYAIQTGRFIFVMSKWGVKALCCEWFISVILMLYFFLLTHHLYTTCLQAVSCTHKVACLSKALTSLITTTYYLPKTELLICLTATAHLVCRQRWQKRIENLSPVGICSPCWNLMSPKRLLPESHPNVKLWLILLNTFLFTESWWTTSGGFKSEHWLSLLSVLTFTLIEAFRGVMNERWIVPLRKEQIAA